MKEQDTSLEYFAKLIDLESGMGEVVYALVLLYRVGLNVTYLYADKLEDFTEEAR